MNGPDVPQSALTAPIEAALAETTGLKPPWQLKQIYSRGSPHGPNIVYRARHLASGQLLAVKANASAEVNELQFEALAKLQRLTEDSVRPLLLDPERRFFLMEWYDAPLALERMQASTRLATIAAAASWLRGLHRGTRGCRRAIDPLLQEDLMPGDRCGGQEEVEARLQSRRDQLRSLKGTLSTLHTDFQLHNLFEVEGRIVAFDRVSDRRGLGYFDVAKFLVGAELYRSLAERRSTPWADDFDTDREVFWKAYGPLHVRQLPLYDFVEDLVLARLWRFFQVRKTLKHCRERAICLEEMMKRRGLRDPLEPRPIRVVRSGLLRRNVRVRHETYPDMSRILK